jgi:DNA-binding transcriptional MerR regulator
MPDVKSYKRTEIAKMFGIGIETLRYYESIKLITVPKRDKNGYRRYAEDSLAEMKFILILKKFGFSLSEISIFMKSIKKSNKVNKDDLKKILSEKILEIDEKIQKMNEFKIMLTELKESSHLGECDALKSLLKST